MIARTSGCSAAVLAARGLRELPCSASVGSPCAAESAIVQRVPVCPGAGGKPRRQVSRRLGFGPQLDHAAARTGPGARSGEMRVQHRLPPGSTASAITSRKLASRARHPPPARPSAPPSPRDAPSATARVTAAGAVGSRRCRPDRVAAAWVGREAPNELAGRRQFDDMAQPDQHHLGRRAPVGRRLDLRRCPSAASATRGQAPGSTSDRPVPRPACVRPPAIPATARRAGTACSRDRVCTAPACPAAACRDRRRARAPGR